MTEFLVYNITIIPLFIMCSSSVFLNLMHSIALPLVSCDMIFLLLLYSVVGLLYPLVHRIIRG